MDYSESGLQWNQAARRRGRFGDRKCENLENVQQYLGEVDMRLGMIAVVEKRLRDKGADRLLRTHRGREGLDTALRLSNKVSRGFL